MQLSASRLILPVTLFGSALFLAVGLMGCKSNRTDEAPPNPVPVPSRLDDRSDPAPARSSINRQGQPVIACFGDSLTAGYGADDGQSYPDFLQKDLDQEGYRYRVVNEGVSGNTTKDGIDRLPQVLALKPAIVVLEFGGNDGLRGFKTEATRANLATMIEALQRAGIKVILAGITLPPDYGPDYVKAFTGNYSALAHQYKLPLLPFILKDVYGVPGLMQADNIHATNRGNAVVARNVLPVVEPLLKK